MIFRAVFWIGIVSLLMPHEPDLGLGRPGASVSSPVPLVSAEGISRAEKACGIQACADALAFASAFGTPTLDRGRGLADVKVEIEADIRARKDRRI